MLYWCEESSCGLFGLYLAAGILLAVTIIYQYFEAWEKEKAQGQMLF